MKDSLIYVSYGDNAVIYDTQSGVFSIQLEGYGEIIKNASLIVENSDGEKLRICKNRACSTERQLNIENNIIKITYDGNDLCNPTLEFRTDKKCVTIVVTGTTGRVAYIEGEAFFGKNMQEDTFAMAIGRSGLDIRCAMGPASSTVDNALYNRKTDCAFLAEGGKKVQYKYNWEKGCYDIRLEVGMVAFQQKFELSLKKNVLSDMYGIPFSPINKNSTFKKPPAGWMTWYAVKFDACEESVLENVKFQEENLKKYGADAIWIDWEWYHNNLNGVRSDGVNTFVPDPEKYPHGMKFISDEIKKAGFVPALWLGFTNDSSRNEFTQKHPEIILGENAEWCGCEFYDISHPLYLEEFLPKALGQVFDWGYEAVKFDTLPICIDYHEKYHMKMYDPTLSTREAFRRAMQKARDFLGKDMYMLSCASVKDPDFLWAADIFDAGRVGNDIFEWKEFIKEGVERTLKFYPLHNIVIYPDADNVVLREEFNTLNQAESRIFFVSLLGLPMTFGDDFKALSEDRVDLIKKCLPVMDIHPMDINTALRDRGQMIMNLAIETSFESYNVVNVFNTNGEDAQRRVNIESDLHLEEGRYHIFDYMNEKYTGCVSDFFEVNEVPYESRIFCVRKNLGIPQIVSTSRHVSQGGVEIKELSQDELRIKFKAELIEEDIYKVFVYVPDGFKLLDEKAIKADENIYCVEYKKDKDGIYDFEIRFEKE